MVETEEAINSVLPDLDRMIGGGLVTLERAKVIMYRPANVRPSQQEQHRIEGLEPEGWAASYRAVESNGTGMGLAGRSWPDSPISRPMTADTPSSTSTTAQRVIVRLRLGASRFLSSTFSVRRALFSAAFSTVAARCFRSTG